MTGSGEWMEQTEEASGWGKLFKAFNGDQTYFCMEREYGKWPIFRSYQLYAGWPLVVSLQPTHHFVNYSNKDAALAQYPAVTNLHPYRSMASRWVPRPRELLQRIPQTVPTYKLCLPNRGALLYEDTGTLNFLLTVRCDGRCNYEGRRRRGRGRGRWGGRRKGAGENEEEEHRRRRLTARTKRGWRRQRWRRGTKTKRETRKDKRRTHGEKAKRRTRQDNKHQNEEKKTENWRERKSKRRAARGERWERGRG